MKDEYTAFHRRARKELANDPCAEADDSCRGPLQVSFRHDAPEEFVRWTLGGRVNRPWKLIPYYVGVVRDGYVRMCISHHSRYDKEEPGPKPPDSALALLEGAGIRRKKRID